MQSYIKRITLTIRGIKGIKGIKGIMEIVGMVKGEIEWIIKGIMGTVGMTEDIEATMDIIITTRTIEIVHSRVMKDAILLGFGSFLLFAQSFCPFSSLFSLRHFSVHR
jgi:hypothetical protein